MPHTKGLAQAVKSALTKLPVSVNALAKRAGVSQSFMSRILAGERTASPAVAAKIASALDVWGRDARAAARALRRGVRSEKG